MSEAKLVEAMPTLKQIATVLGVQVERVRSVAKKPIVGQAYDPKATNWDAIKAFIGNRLERTGYDTVEDVLAAALDVEITVASRGTGAKIQMLDIEGSVTTPSRRCELNPGDIIVEKKSGAEFVVDYVNATIVVIKPISAEGKETLSHAIGNRIFNNKYAKKTDAE